MSPIEPESGATPFSKPPSSKPTPTAPPRPSVATRPTPIPAPREATAPSYPNATWWQTRRWQIGGGALLLLLIILTASLFLRGGNESLIGEWYSTTSPVDKMERLIFFKDGTATLDSVGPLTIRAYGSTPESKIEKYESHYTYSWSVEGDKLKTEIKSYRAVMDGEDATTPSQVSNVRTSISKIKWVDGEVSLLSEGFPAGHPFGTWKHGKP